MFKDVFVFHLPQFKLDRTPILVKLFRDGPPNRHHKPFCFLSPWVMHEDFTRFMKENWRRKSLWNPYLKLLSKSSKSGTNWFLVIFLLKRSNFWSSSKTSLTWEQDTLTIFLRLSNKECGISISRSLLKKRFYGTRNPKPSGLLLVIKTQYSSMESCPL